MIFCEGTKAFKKKSAKHLGDYWDYELFFWESSHPDRTVKALLLALLLEQGTPHCMEAQRCCLNKWQASQRSKAFKQVSFFFFFFFSGTISRCNTFGAWRYFDDSKFWFCLFCIYIYIDTFFPMVFSLNLCVLLKHFITNKSLLRFPKAATMPAVSYARLQGHVPWLEKPSQLQVSSHFLQPKKPWGGINGSNFRTSVRKFRWNTASLRCISLKHKTPWGTADKAFQLVGSDAWQWCLGSPGKSQSQHLLSENLDQKITLVMGPAVRELNIKGFHLGQPMIRTLTNQFTNQWYTCYEDPNPQPINVGMSTCPPRLGSVLCFVKSKRRPPAMRWDLVEKISKTLGNLYVYTPSYAHVSMYIYIYLYIYHHHVKS